LPKEKVQTMLYYAENLKSSNTNLTENLTRFVAASDKAYQLLAHGWWFSPGTPASSTTKTGRHDIAEILLKVAIYGCPLHFV
jgi:hypothetical protein